ncbi:hypothetical protein QE418_000597 [Microbacterium testaceum]|uniref:hypothetical protein n=1 Tax=Microbacterium TaxID=33882 RepID=UPI002788F9EE|nr:MULTISPECIES: hypothetical protein [Microbacterium]MDQ1111149.1 hypothetical protein [Microbacterium testaceum]MDR6098312.1 hypothetical protein [Microbacterium sp. SORGH_AS_0454]
MNKADAIKAIEAVRTSLVANPQQTLTIENLIGAQFGGGSGTTLIAPMVAPSGGGNYDTVIGMDVSTQVTVSPSMANSADAAIGAATAQLDAIIAELRKPAPDRGLLSRLVGSLAEKGVPAAAAAAIGPIVTAALGG